MAVTIRMSRIGKKNRPFFRVVASDSRKKRDGQVLANIGTYDPITSSVVLFDEEVYNQWISKGAIPSDTVKKVYRLFKKGDKAPLKSEPAPVKVAKSTVEADDKAEQVA